MWKIFAASVILVLSLLLIAGCETPQPIPVATPTRTPVIPTPTPTLTPTMTPTSTPTRTPTPTPTLPPNLVLPPSPEKASDWLSLPADLYFVRNGHINIWLAEGTHIEIPLLAEDSNESVHSYRVTPDGRFIAYITTSGKLYRLDRATWEHTFLPTSGYLIEQNETYFMLTVDGNHIYYIAWGTQPSTASSPQSATPSGTILSINAQQPRALQKVIGYCQGVGDTPCLDFALSPDERQIAFLDGHGSWLTNIESANPRFLAPYGDDVVVTDLSWSPNGRWLLLSGDTSQAFLFDTTIVEPIPQTVQLCDKPCEIEQSWAANTLWFIIKEAAQACLVEVNPDTIVNDQSDIMSRICQMDGWGLQPTELHALQDNRILFLHRGCESPCEGPAAGLYIRNEDNTIYPVALTKDVDGTTYWTSDGSAFLYAGTTDLTRRIGLLQESTYWDVTTILRDSTGFVWGEPSSAVQ